MKLTSKKFFFVMLAVFTLSIVGGGAMLYLSNSILQKRSSNVVELKLQSAEVEAQAAAYQAAKKDVEKYAYLTDIINSALPQDKDQARSVREIFVLAQQAGITIKSIQFPASSLGAVTALPPAAAATTAPAAAPTTPAPAAAPVITQAKPVKGLSGVYSLQAIVTPFADDKTYKVTYAQLIKFLEKIESNRRAIQVANLQLNPLGQSSTDTVSFTLTLNIFIKP